LNAINTEVLLNLNRYFSAATGQRVCDQEQKFKKLILILFNY